MVTLPTIPSCSASSLECFKYCGGSGSSWYKHFRSLRRGTGRWRRGDGCWQALPDQRSVGVCIGHVPDFGPPRAELINKILADKLHHGVHAQITVTRTMLTSAPVFNFDHMQRINTGTCHHFIHQSSAKHCFVRHEEHVHAVTAPEALFL